MNALGNGTMDDFDFSKEAAVERRCSDAFAAVQHFEKTHCLALQHMALPYLQRRPQLVATCLTQAAQLGLKDEVSHDAVLLMDRTMSTGLEVCVHYMYPVFCRPLLHQQRLCMLSGCLFMSIVGVVTPPNDGRRYSHMQAWPSEDMRCVYVGMQVLILVCCDAQVKDDYMNLVAAACVLVASKQGERPSQVPTDQQLESVTGLQVCALPCPALHPCLLLAGNCPQKLCRSEV